MSLSQLTRRACARLAVAVLVSAVVSAACTAPEPDSPLVRGPLCDLLPKGSEPGAPALLVDEPADVVLTWIPVLTHFEAMARASGLAADLRTMEDLTILAPTDAAFEQALSEETRDALILFRQDELRWLLESHVLVGALPLAELRAAGSVTALNGYSLRVAPAGEMALIEDGAETVCADYVAANARIHLIDAVLGEMPEPAPSKPSSSRLYLNWK